MFWLFEKAKTFPLKKPSAHVVKMARFLLHEKPSAHVVKMFLNIEQTVLYMQHEQFCTCNTKNLPLM
jgi:predicted nucleic acid-binding Zn finger protein